MEELQMKDINMKPSMTHCLKQIQENEFGLTSL